jgi:hypothetical protein
LERAGPRVPHLRRLVSTAGGDARAVGTERHAPHLTRSHCGVGERSSSAVVLPARAPQPLSVARCSPLALPLD